MLAYKKDVLSSREMERRIDRSTFVVNNVLKLDNTYGTNMFTNVNLHQAREKSNHTTECRKAILRKIGSRSKHSSAQIYAISNGIKKQSLVQEKETIASAYYNA